MDDEVLTKSELAEFLKVTERTVDRMRDQGMPSFNVGNRIRFEKAQVLQWLKEHSKEN